MPRSFWFIMEVGSWRCKWLSGKDILDRFWVLFVFWFEEVSELMLLCFDCFALFLLLREGWGLDFWGLRKGKWWVWNGFMILLIRFWERRECVLICCMVIFGNLRNRFQSSKLLAILETAEFWYLGISGYINRLIYWPPYLNPSITT